MLASIAHAPTLNTGWRGDVAYRSYGSDVESVWVFISGRSLAMPETHPNGSLPRPLINRLAMLAGASI